MRISGIAAVFVLAVAWSTSVSADDANVGDTDKEKVVCKSAAPTGSRIKKTRRCMTTAQWQELADRTKQDIDRFSRSAGSSAPQSQNPLTGR